MKSITIYTTATCGYCRMLKGYLVSKNVQFSEKHADQDPNLARELYEKSGQLGVPFSVITDDSGKEELVLGFDQQRINAALGL